LGEKILDTYKKIVNNNILLAFIIATIIFLSVFFQIYILIILLFLYVAIFNKNYILAILITVPIYEAHFFHIPLSINKALIIILFTVFILNIKYKKIKITKNEIIILLLLLVVTIGSLVGLFNSELTFMRNDILKEYIFETLPKIGFMFLFVLAIKMSKKFNLKKMVEKAVYFIPIFIVFVGVLAYKTHYGIDFTRSGILNIRPNYFAVFTISMIPFIIYAFFHCKEKIMIGISLLAILVELYILSLTQSRTGILMFGVSFIISVIVFYKLNKKRLLIGIPLIVGGIIAIMFLPTFYGIIERVLEAKYFTSLENLLNGRYDLYRAGGRALLRNPIIGYGNSKDVTGYYIYSISGIAQVAHNTFLDIIIQYGAYGTIIFLGIYLYFISEFSIKAFSKLNEKYIWEFPIYIMFISILVAGLFLSIDLRDIAVYTIMLLLALPYREKIKEVNNGT